MNKEGMIEFMDMIEEGRTNHLMDKNLGKKSYKCSNCDAVFKRIVHHIRKHHATPRTKCKKCFLFSLYVRMYGCIHVGWYLCMFIYLHAIFVSSI